MKFTQSVSLTFAAVGLLFLGACASGGTPPASTEASPSTSAIASPATSPEAMSPAMSPEAMAKGSGAGSQGGQVVEAGAYHLELVPEPETDAIHLDFYLQKGDNHEAIADAKVKAQVQLPDGSQKSLDMKYDAEGKHYTVALPGTVAGKYNVAILSDISGEKVNGRFNFTK